ncbi:7611_t:CDS:2 [Acaulospora colombiana]|uniref:7611_t:CDS:1 n=1 Tax=Acaulospora colombiana TaxID=27376 RepID=A0ACA9KAD1_9GLOM|nr:7611_t:CDS:2 [Acaulospora colombiana]
MVIPNVSGYQVFVHNETQPFPTAPRIWQLISYDDGTTVARVIHKDPNVNSTNTTTFIDQRLSLRIIYPNGTVSEIDKDPNIPSFNYAITLATPDVFDPINIRVLQVGYVLVTYFDASDAKNYSTYEEWGLIMGWDGTIHRLRFGFAYTNSGLWNPDVTSVVTNIDPKKGFLRISGIRETNNVEWQQYFMDSNFQLDMMSSGVIANSLLAFGSSQVDAIATIDEGYAIIIANSTSVLTRPVNPLSVRSGVYAFTKAFDDQQFGSTLLLYQSPVEGLNFTSLKCDVSWVGIGELCSITLQQTDSLSLLNNYTTFYIKLTFLSSGSVTGFTPISRQLPHSTNITVLEWQVRTLPYGGYLLYSYTQLPSELKIYGYVYDDVSVNPTNWELSEPMLTNLRGTFTVLPNNTMLLSQPESINSWSLINTDLPKFAASRDHGYFNVQVNSTNPAISSTISTSTNNITISFFDPVILSVGNISIYQVDANRNTDNLRQIVSGTLSSDFCSISGDGLTVTVKTIDSTFSRPGVQYFVQVDNNFVQDKAYKEPLMGIRANVWNFNTGTAYFDGLDDNGKSRFFSNLLTELSNILPVSLDRLSSNEKTQVDSSISPGTQILISLNIESTRDERERNVPAIVKDLNTMVVNKAVTPIGLNPTTRYLDDTYGFSPTVNLWEKYRMQLLIIFLTIVLLVVLFVLAQRRERKGRNIAILQLGVILFDLFMDILFVSNNGEDVKSLYVPSVIFLTVPIGLNTIWAFLIIMDENTRPEFFKWFSRHGKVASIFTVLSGADIEALTVLYSSLAGFPFFNAPFSETAKTRIFWAACLNIFTEDIPQMVIQVRGIHAIFSITLK